MTETSWWNKQIRVSSLPQNALRDLRFPDPPAFGEAEAVVRHDDGGICFNISFPSAFPVPADGVFSSWLTPAGSNAPVAAVPTVANDEGLFQLQMPVGPPPTIYIPVMGLKNRVSGKHILHLALYGGPPGKAPRHLLHFAFDVNLPSPTRFDRATYLKPLYLLAGFVAGSTSMPNALRSWLQEKMGFDRVEMSTVQSMWPLVPPADIGSVVDGLILRVQGLPPVETMRLLAQIANQTGGRASDRVRKVFVDGFMQDPSIWPQYRDHIGLR